MYAVREEAGVLKGRIKELTEKSSQLEQGSNLLEKLVSPEQLTHTQAQQQTGFPPATGATQPPAQPAPWGSGWTPQPAMTPTELAAAVWTEQTE